MPTPTEIKSKFWKELKSQRTIMLGLADARDGDTRPMTVLIEGDEGGPLYSFTARDSDLVEAIGPAARGIATFTSKGHDLFASLHGTLSLETDRAVIDRLWNPYVAAWFEGGKDDPRLALLRLDPEEAKIWLNATPLGAAIQWLLGRDPKQAYKDKVVEVAL